MVGHKTGGGHGKLETSRGRLGGGHGKLGTSRGRPGEDMVS